MDLPESFPLTYELLFKLVNPLGNYTKATCEALGVKFPPKSTWQMKFVGKVITREKYLEAMAGKEPKKYQPPPRDNEVARRTNPGWAVMGGQYTPGDGELEKAMAMAIKAMETEEGRSLAKEERELITAEPFIDGHWEWKFGDRHLVSMLVKWDRGSSKWISKIVLHVAQ